MIDYDFSSKVMIEIIKNEQFEFKDIIEIYKCGKSIKYAVDHTFLIIISDSHKKINLRNYHDTGTSSITKSEIWHPPNKKYLFQYKIITESAFINLSWETILDQIWNMGNLKDLIHDKLDLKLIKRYLNLQVFT